MKVLIAGMGLIGGSFALALRDRGIADEILGTDSSGENAAEALRLGLADRIVAFEEGIPQADLVVLATPVDTIPLMAVKALNRVEGHQVVMDTGLHQGRIVRGDLDARPPRALRGRPSDVGHRVQRAATPPSTAPSRAATPCFARRSAATPTRWRRPSASSARWRRPPCYMDAEEHDLHAAYVSHISHITSFALALTVLEKEREERHIFDLAGGGFEAPCGWPRVRPRTWVPILLRNKYNVLDVLREHIHQLQIMRRMIERDDAEGLTAAIAAGQLRSSASSTDRAWARRPKRGARANAPQWSTCAGAGYEICALNWRSGRYELDIVARKAGIVHFVEVKTRRAGSLTPPEAAVTPQKFRALTRAAVRYLAATGGQRRGAVRPGGRGRDARRAHGGAPGGACDGIQLVILHFRQIILPLSH